MITSHTLHRDAATVLRILGELTGSAQVQLVVDGSGSAALVWSDRHVPGDSDEVAVLEDFAQRWLGAPDRGQLEIFDVEGWRVAISSIGTDSSTALVLARGPRRPWQESELDLIRLAAALLATPAADASAHPSRLRLQALLDRAATSLGSASAKTMRLGIGNLLGQLAAHLDADVAYLRRLSPDGFSSEVVAHWPANEPVAAIPDPFEGGSALAGSDLQIPRVLFTNRVDAPGRPESHVSVPVLAAGAVVGALGVTTWAARQWTAEDLGTLQMLAILLEQAQARACAEEALNERTYLDELTGLPNRRALFEVHAHNSAWQDRSVAVFTFDVDRMQSVNDLISSAAGDALLAEMAVRIRAWMQPGDVAVRLGGDEFAIVRADLSDAEAAAQVAGELADLLAAPVEADGWDIARTVSVGVAFDGPGSGDVTQLSRHADLALAEAKQAGGAGVTVFDDAMRARAEQRAEVERHLRDAVPKGQLRAFYQPEFDLRTGELTAMEALVRWQHPTLGLLEPSAFLEVAVENGTILEIGDWVLGEVCRQRAAWLAENPEKLFAIRINATISQLLDDDLVDDVLACLTEHGVKGEQLCVEFAERDLPADVTGLCAALAELASIGVGAALDDLGGGRSSLEQLRALPITTVKIDRRLVVGSDTALLAAAIATANAFGFTVVAKGVETELQARDLWRLGCRQAQGNLLGEPVPAAMLRDVVAPKAQ